MFKFGNLTITDGKIKSKVYNQNNELTGYIAELTVQTAILLETDWIRCLVAYLDNLAFENEKIENDTEDD